MLFEVGRIYLPRERDLPREPEMVAGLMCGSRSKPSWLGDGGESDFFDAKGVVDTVLAKLGIAARYEQINDPALRAGRCAAITAGGELLGVVGQVQPTMAEAFELGRFPAYLFELDLEELLAFIPGQRRCQPLPRFPVVMRDLALVVDVSLPHERIEQVLKSSSLVSQVTLFDLYRGEQVPAGRKSLAYHLVYQSPEHTLTDADVDQAEQRILQRLRLELGATPRA
jgi:phenylalanyl-tRNA synthetase beta chain